MIQYLKHEKVLLISLVLAALSALLVPPDRGYLSYIDVRVLALLFCLMLLVKGFQDMGLFDSLISRLFNGVHSSRRLCQLLILLCFLTSMVITNDVALITFVPFAILALDLCGQRKRIVPVVVLQTVAANLGSMATPIGNPQNLYLFSGSGMGAGEFLATMLPLTGLSLVLLMAATLLLPNVPIQMDTDLVAPALPRRELIAYSALFALNLLVVFHVLTWLPVLVVTVAGVLLLGKRALLRHVDYALLLTFVGFFIFVGNLGRFELVRSWLVSAVQGREVLLSILFSQVLSNVPTAILLSGFTDNFAGLLVGTNVGGLGTLIASMASLISYKLYASQSGANTGRYLFIFTLCNLAGLAVLIPFSLLL